MDLVVPSRTELMSACERGELHLARQLLSEVNLQDSTGRTALMFAAQAAQIEVIQLLLEHHADVQRRNCAGHTCVMFAVGAGLKVESPQDERALRHLQAVRMLLDEGAPVNGSTGYGLSALMLASTSGRINMMELLLDRGADVNMASDIGLTALVMASDKGHTAAVRLLLQRAADANARYANGKTPLMSAAAQAYSGVVDALLEHHAHVNAQSGDGHTALLYAAEMQLKDGLVCPVEGAVTKPQVQDTVRILLAAAAEVNLKGPRGRSALHVAVCSSADLAQRLVAAKAAVTAKDEEGQTPLTLAAERNIDIGLSRLPAVHHKQLGCFSACACWRFLA
ncbi:unnamed protein product [Effrenium voratum]|nr:unnamed protein product [Effrenium voratum]